MRQRDKEKKNVSFTFIMCGELMCLARVRCDISGGFHCLLIIFIYTYDDT